MTKGIELDRLSFGCFLPLANGEVGVDEATVVSDLCESIASMILVGAFPSSKKEVCGDGRSPATVALCAVESSLGSISLQSTGTTITF